MQGEAAVVPLSLETNCTSKTLVFTGGDTVDLVKANSSSTTIKLFLHP